MPETRAAESNRTTRDRVVGVRVDRATLKAIDLLVESGVFDTRSQAASWLIRAGIDAQGDLFDRIATTAAQIRDLKARAQTITHTIAAGPKAPEGG